MIILILNQVEKKDEDLLKTAVSIAENFIKSFFMGDFEKAKIDFDEEMKTNFDISSLKNIQEQTIVKTGNLQELGKPIVNKKEDNFFIIEYPQAKSEKKEKIMIQVVFKNDSENNLKISGFWFDSPDDLWKEE